MLSTRKQGTCLLVLFFVLISSKGTSHNMYHMEESSSNDDSDSSSSSCSGTSTPVTATSPAPRVVIVGAGYAGVAAAGVLRAGGITDVTVLEAQSRPGGRVQTLHLEDGHLEIGAQFLHGQNEIYGIAERSNNLLDEEGEEGTEILPDTVLQYHEYDFYLPGGHRVDGDVILENLRALEGLHDKATYALSQGVADDVNVSMGQFFRERYAHAMSTTSGEETLKRAMLRWFENWAKMDAAGSVDQLSLPGMGRYVYVPGSGVKETRTGMEDVFKCLLHLSLPLDNLRLNKPVKRIHWSDKMADHIQGCPDLDDVTSRLERTVLRTNSTSVSSGAELSEAFSEEAGGAISDVPESIPRELLSRENRTNLSEGSASERTMPSAAHSPTKRVDSQQGGGNGSYRVRIECEDGEVVHADHVIVTSSIGFLKDNEDFFKPQLPSRHRKAVGSMGFGNVAKMFLVWDLGEDAELQGDLSCEGDAVEQWQRTILGMDMWGAVFLWPEGVRPQLKSAVSSMTTSIGRQWFEDISLWEVPSGHDTCIAAWIGGEAATLMETIPESEVKDVLHEMLMLFLNKPSIPPPSRVIRSMWHSNPYTRGAYSYLATGLPLELHDVLGQPVPCMEDPVLQLAGEACSKNFYSTAHGALESGSLAARALLRHYGMENECQN